MITDFDRVSFLCAPVLVLGKALLSLALNVVKEPVSLETSKGNGEESCLGDLASGL